MKPNFDKYVNIPFSHKGRDFNGCDCYGLVWLIFKTERNITLPNFLDIDYSCGLEDRDNQIEQQYIKQLKQGWVSADAPYKRWDCLIFYTDSRKDIADHIGLYIGDGKFLHTSRKLNDTVVVKLNDFWENRIYDVARWVGDLDV